MRSSSRNLSGTFLKTVGLALFALTLQAAPVQAELGDSDCFCACETKWVKVAEGEGCDVDVEQYGKTVAGKIIWGASHTYLSLYGVANLNQFKKLKNGGCDLPLPLPPIERQNDAACGKCMYRTTGELDTFQAKLAEYQTKAKQKELCYAASGSRDPEIARKWYGTLQVKGERADYQGSIDRQLLCRKWKDGASWMGQTPISTIKLECEKVFRDEVACTNGATGGPPCKINQGGFGSSNNEPLNAAAGAHKALTQAKKHLDGDATGDIGDGLSDTNAAIAGSTGSLHNPEKGITKSALNGISSLSPSSGFDSSGYPGGSAGNGATGSLFGSSETKDKAGTDPNAQSLSMIGADGNSAYSQGGKAPSASGPKHGLALSGAGIEREIALGRSPASGGDGLSGADGLLEGDPEDYFTRIGMNEDLFKKVENRYRKKSNDWARISILRK